MKKLVALTLLVICSMVARAQNVEITSHASTEKPPRQLSDSVVNYGRLFLKTPYRYGSTGPSSFDCSGFTSHVYKNFGYTLDHSSAGQAKQAPAVPRHQLQTGDLVFFEGRRHNGQVGHVGIVVDTDSASNEFKFIHASCTQGVVISHSSEDYYKSRYLKAGRILPDSIRADATPTNVPAKESVEKPAPIYHIVRTGDTLYSLAKNNGTTVEHIKQCNHLQSDVLKIGQKIQLN